MTYLDRPVFDFRPDFKEVEHGQLDDHTFDSQGSGAATPWKPTSGARRTLSLPFTFGSRADLDELRAFIRERAGRRRGFWLPVWLTDYELVDDVAADATEITIESVDLPDVTQFKHLFLATRTELVCVPIESVADNGDTQTITLGAAPGVAFTAERTVCGGLLFARLATDEIEYAFGGHNFAIAELIFTELPAEYETEHEGERPIFLYELTRGAALFRYANYGKSVTAGGFTWDPQNISHGSIHAGIDMLGGEVDLRIGTDDELHPVRRNVDTLDLAVTNLRILEIDGDDPPAVLPAPIYQGRLGQMTFGAAGTIEAQSSSAFRLAEVQTPRPYIARHCIHRLGDEFCTVNLADFTTAGTITALGTAYVEADEFGAKATAESDPNWFVFGLVTVGTERRFCTGADGNRLYLNAPFRFAAVDDAISAEAGCDKKIATCDAKFSNREHHVGFFYTPNQNPQFKGANVPAATGAKK